MGKGSPSPGGTGYSTSQRSAQVTAIRLIIASIKQKSPYPQGKGQERRYKTLTPLREVVKSVGEVVDLASYYQ
jgi:hypothetical protein